MSISKNRDGYRACVQLPGGQRQVKTFPVWSRARDWETAQLATVAATPVRSGADDSPNVGVVLMDDYLSQEELVVHLKHAVALGTLRNWRSEHRGPRYVTIGRTVLYPREQVEAWLAEQEAQAFARWDDRKW